MCLDIHKNKFNLKLMVSIPMRVFFANNVTFLPKRNSATSFQCIYQVAYAFYLLRDYSLPGTILGVGYMPMREQSLCICERKAFQYVRWKNCHIRITKQDKGLKWELLFHMLFYIGNDMSPGREEISHIENSGKTVPERGNNKSKGPDVEICLAISRET